jgi:hypothetical protein
MLPLLAAGIGLAAWARTREQTILARALGDAAGRGWLHPAEVHWLVRLGDRAAARRFATKVAGPDAAKALHAYQQACTEMAFMHDRVLRGSAPADGIERWHAHLQRMHSWRPFVVMPPVSWSAPVGPAPPPSLREPRHPPGPSDSRACERCHHRPSPPPVHSQSARRTSRCLARAGCARNGCADEEDACRTRR